MSIPGFTADRSVGVSGAGRRLKTTEPSSRGYVALQGGMGPGENQYHVSCGPCLDASAFPEYTSLLRGCSYKKCCTVDQFGNTHGCSMESCGCSPMSGQSYQTDLYNRSDLYPTIVHKYFYESLYAYPFKWPP
jgi:hypothetical protein